MYSTTKRLLEVDGTFKALKRQSLSSRGSFYSNLETSYVEIVDRSRACNISINSTEE
jgi:hypothetical protein